MYITLNLKIEEIIKDPITLSIVFGTHRDLTNSVAMILSLVFVSVTMATHQILDKKFYLG